MAGRWRTFRKMRAKTNHFKPVLEMAVAPLARGLTAASAQFLSGCFCRRAKRQRGKGVPCVDGSALARTFFARRSLVGAAMCSAFVCGLHDRWP